MDSPIVLPDAHEARMLLREHLTALLALAMDLHGTSTGAAIGKHAAALLPVLALYSFADPPSDEERVAA